MDAFINIAVYQSSQRLINNTPEDIAIFDLLVTRGVTLEYGPKIEKDGLPPTYEFIRITSGERIAARILHNLGNYYSNSATLDSAIKLIENEEKFPAVRDVPKYMRDIVIGFMKYYGFNHDAEKISKMSASQLIDELNCVYINIFYEIDNGLMIGSKRRFGDDDTLLNMISIRNDIISMIKEYSTSSSPVPDPRYASLLEKYNAIKKLIN